MGMSKELLKGLLDNPNFQKWFGKSTVRDAEGLPLEVFHGTANSFDTFAPTGMGAGSRESGLGHWFTENPDVADNFANFARSSDREKSGPAIIPGNLKMENPWKPETYDEVRDLIDKFTSFERPGYMFRDRNIRMQGDKVDHAAAVDHLKSQGYDGIMLEKTRVDSPDDGKTLVNQYIALDPTQFKSRFNQGTFDPTDPNFLKSAGLMTAGAGSAYGLARNNDGSMSVGPGSANAMSYIGPKGMANFLGPDKAKALLSEAEQLAAKGVDNEAVRQATGVFKGMDGKWRYELDDAASQVLRPQYPPNFMNQAAKEAGFGNYVDIPMAERKPINARADQLKLEYVDPFSSFSAMSNHFKHDDLYKAYPELADAPTRVDSKAKHQGVAYGDGSIEYGGGTISGGGDRPTLLHELQHAIQQQEGFAVGGTPSLMAWASPSQRGDLLKVAQQTMDGWKPATYEQFWGKEITPEGQAAYADYLKEFSSKEQEAVRWNAAQQGAPGKIYENLAGEIEARDTAKRMDFTPEQRRATPPDLRDNAIVRFDGNEAASMPAPAQAESPSAIREFLDTVLRGAKTVGNGIDSASKTLGPLVMNAPSRFATAAVNDPVGTASQVADFVVPFKGSAKDYADAFYHNQDATWLDKLNALAGIGLDAAFMGHGNQAKTALSGLMR